MDDFFLPPELRTAERLATSGGNIHHERFLKEILPYVKSGKEFKYRQFDCNFMDYRETPAVVHSHPWCIVEGVYSCHPIFENYMDLRVFVDVTQDEQKARIKRRNSPEMAARYIEKWIPMEEAYFEAYNIRNAADVIVSTSSPAIGVFQSQ